MKQISRIQHDVHLPVWELSGTLRFFAFLETKIPGTAVYQALTARAKCQLMNNVINFEEEVINLSKKKPVVVDFWAPWCGPCKMLGPILDRAYQRSNGKWELKKVNVDENPELSARYGIRGIPAVKLFTHGKVSDEFTGVIPENSFLKWLEKHIPNEEKTELNKILEEINSGNREMALSQLEEFIRAHPENKEARLAMARLIYRTEPEKALQLLSDIREDSDLFEDAAAISVLSLLLIKGKNAEELEESTVKSKYLDAIEAIRNAAWDRALRQMIDVILEEKQYDSEGARKAVIAIFRLLGRDHELTRKYRKRFDMSLY